MATIASIPITTAVTGAVTPAASSGSPTASALTVQIDFVWGSGGTSGVVYVQTSLDGGVTWCDIVNMTFTTASKSRIQNLQSRTAVAPFAPTDGTLASDTVKDGVLGGIYRTKVSTVGTYAGGTTLTVTVLPQP